MSRTITHEKKNKFSKSSFSREKTFAMSEQDIMKNEKKMNEYQMKRGAEREANIRTASGIIEDEFQENTATAASYTNNINANWKFYFEKMNFIIQNLPPKINIDMVLREFSQYGKITYITYTNDRKGYKLVVDKWSEDHADTISQIQMDIWENGKHEWTCPWVGSYITRDPDQTLAELGDKVEWNDNDDDDLNNCGNY